jgi:hypothetical protein
MLYNIWIHFNGSSAKNAGIISPTPLRERSNWINGKMEQGQPKAYGQVNVTLEVTGSDDKAFVELDKAYRLRFPHEKRPLAGKTYLKDCRESFRQAKGGNQ